MRIKNKARPAKIACYGVVVIDTRTEEIIGKGSDRWERLEDAKQYAWANNFELNNQRDSVTRYWEYRALLMDFTEVNVGLRVKAQTWEEFKRRTREKGFSLKFAVNQALDLWLAAEKDLK